MMMRKSFIAIVSIIVLSTVLFSCKKDVNQSEIDRGLIEEYILANNLDGQYTSSGLYYVIEEPGGIDHPNVYSEVTVTYKGYSLSGVVFDEGKYYTNNLNNLILGWQEGLQLIGDEGIIKLVIPSGLAYGSNGSSSIQPNEVIAFDITLHYFAN